MSLVRKWGEQIVRSRQHASGVALVFAFFSFFNLPILWLSLSIIIIALVTLQNGPKQGLLVIAWAILPAVAMLCLGHYAIFINIAILHYLMVWCFAVLLRKHNAWTQVLQLSSFLGIVAIVGIYFLAPDLKSGLVAEFSALIKEYKNFSFLNFSPSDLDLWTSYLGLFAIGILALATLLANLMVLFLARWWQSLIVPTVSLQKECLLVRVHYSSSLVLITLAAGLALNTGLFVNILLVALMPFMLSGLSLLHAYTVNKKNGNTILFIFYVLFLFLSPYLMMLLSLIGWLDSFINVRKRFTVKNSLIED